ncbi:zf-UBP-domain-containing protein [Piedraia hortae CBS 480.64]|uniref:Zf-UBP-domain-containing protein n=1 Tax=Piedraia hortae CBS 480.64 TaxID=1314780 RepID=A0A6A7C152_9PEZI|nr:zf-UBP-domain-containing protein [Piedraia hortae CBS 480.64]
MTSRELYAARCIFTTHRYARLCIRAMAKFHLKLELYPTTKTEQANSFPNHSNSDWRHGAVAIVSINMDRKRGKEHIKAVYLPFEEKEKVGHGIVRLYRDDKEPTHPDNAKKKSALNRHAKNKNKTITNTAGTTLCILAVPTWMSPSDFLGFVGEQARNDVSHVRLIRTERMNKYMVLMKFRSAQKALDWQKTNDGRVFSVSDPETCQTVFVDSVQLVSSDTGFFNSLDPFVAKSATVPLSAKELPTCPVCLERMDESTGLLTIPCDHVFHCACLEKWRNSGCPICRYSHNPSFTFPYARPAPPAEHEDALCSVCAGTENLWICLICGNVGCGRYDGAHAYAHYEKTSHCFAMDLVTQHVWDYAGDAYVHRLVQTKADPHHENDAFQPQGDEMVPREKLETVAAEYTCLLTGQLDSQRKHFEELCARMKSQAEAANAHAEAAEARCKEMKEELEQMKKEFGQMQESKAIAESGREKAEKLRTEAERLARSTVKSLQDEKKMSEGMLRRVKASEESQRKLKAELEEMKQAKLETEEINHDLMVSLSGQIKLKAINENLEGATIQIVRDDKDGEGKKKKKKQ